MPLKAPGIEDTPTERAATAATTTTNYYYSSMRRAAAEAAAAAAFDEPLAWFRSFPQPKKAYAPTPLTGYWISC